MAVELNREGARVRKGERVGLRFQAEDCVVLEQDPISLNQADR
jgi:hypothetical protein